MMRHLIAGLWIACTSCAFTASSDAIDASDNPDAPVSGCETVIQVNPDTAAPGPLVTGEAVRLRAVLALPSSDLVDYSWHVRLGVDTIAFTNNPQASEIEFTPTTPGLYAVELETQLGSTTCTTVVSLQVVIPDAPAQLYRFQFDAGGVVPVQEQIRNVYGGAAGFSIGELTLQPGATVIGRVTAPDDSLVPSYLRFSSVGSESNTEVFSPDGQFAAQLVGQLFDVLAVPSSDTAPDRDLPAIFTNVTVSDLQALVLDTPGTITGAVHAPDASAVAGAQILIRSGVSPGLVTTTNASGQFISRVRLDNQPVTIMVTPPSASGLPQLKLAAEAGLALASTDNLTIDYAPGLAPRTIAPVVHTATNQPLPLATVSWRSAELPAAGTVRHNGTNYVATGMGRAQATADHLGQLPGLHLPQAAYSVVITPPSDNELLASSDAIDLRSGTPTPAILRAQPAARITGILRASGSDAPQVGATIIVRPIDAGADVAAVRATTGPDGSYSMQVPAGLAYTWSARSATQTFPILYRAIAAPSPGQIVDMGEPHTLPPLSVSGTLRLPNLAGAATNTRVTVFCVDCPVTDQYRPIAEGVTDPGGRFRLALPAPQ